MISGNRLHRKSIACRFNGVVVEKVRSGERRFEVMFVSIRIIAKSMLDSQDRLICGHTVDLVKV